MCSIASSSDLDHPHREDGREELPPVVVLRGLARRRHERAGGGVAAQLEPALREGGHAPEQRRRDALVDEQALQRVADAGALELAVLDEAVGHLDVAAGVGEEVAHALVVLDHGDARVLGHEPDEPLAAARDGQIDHAGQAEQDPRGLAVERGAPSARRRLAGRPSAARPRSARRGPRSSEPPPCRRAGPRRCRSSGRAPRRRRSRWGAPRRSSRSRRAGRAPARRGARSAAAPSRRPARPDRSRRRPRAPHRRSPRAAPRRARAGRRAPRRRRRRAPRPRPRRSRPAPRRRLPSPASARSRSAIARSARSFWARSSGARARAAVRARWQSARSVPSDRCCSVPQREPSSPPARANRSPARPC